MKGNQRTNELVSNYSVNNKQPVLKKSSKNPERLSIRDDIFFMYCNENSNIIKLILNELDVKTTYTYVLKLLFPAAEIIRKPDQGEGVFFS